VHVLNEALYMRCRWFWFDPQKNDIKAGYFYAFFFNYVFTEPWFFGQKEKAGKCTLIY
jgi:hypothetical protein